MPRMFNLLRTALLATVTVTMTVLRAGTPLRVPTIVNAKLSVPWYPARDW